MLDDRLMGYWSDDDIYQGAMEAADIAFRGDRTGWTYWSQIGGAFAVQRFGWQATRGQLTLDLREKLSGTWTLARDSVQHRVDHRASWDRQITMTYRITAGRNVYGDLATVLELDQPINIGTIGDRFAFKRELAPEDQDPTTHSS